MPDKKNEVAVAAKKPGLIQVFGEKYNVEPALVKETLLKGAFKGVKADHELISLLVIANSYDLNPFLKEMGGFAKDGVVYPMIFKDGWIRVLLRQKSYKGKVYRESETLKQMEGSKPCPEWVECEIRFNDGRDPEVARVRLIEWFRSTPTWKSMPYQMLKGKAMKEAVREAYGINLYDEDDKERILAEGGNEMVIDPSSSSAEKAKQALRATKSSLHAQKAEKQAPVAADEVFVDEVTGEVIDGECVEDEPAPEVSLADLADQALDKLQASREEDEAEAPRATKQQIAAIKAACRNNGWQEEDFQALLATYDAVSEEDLTRDQALEVVRRLVAGPEETDD